METWQHIKTHCEGNQLTIDGHNASDDIWIPKNEFLKVLDPLREEEFKAQVFTLKNNENIEFAATEFSNCVWGIYQKMEDKLKRSNTVTVCKFTRTLSEQKRLRNIFIVITLVLSIFITNRINLTYGLISGVVFGLFAIFKWIQFHRDFIEKITIIENEITFEYLRNGNKLTRKCNLLMTKAKIKIVFDKAGTRYLKITNNDFTLRQFTNGKDWTIEKMIEIEKIITNHNNG
jgi:hypothetical protein